MTERDDWSKASDEEISEWARTISSINPPALKTELARRYLARGGEIERLRVDKESLQEIERAYAKRINQLVETIESHEAAMREAINKGLGLSFTAEDRCRQMIKTLEAQLEPKGDACVGVPMSEWPGGRNR